MQPNDPTFQLRLSGPDDVEFAWGRYRDAMKPVTEELMAWNEDRQRDLVKREIVTGHASIIRTGARDIGWLQLRESTGEIELCQLYLMPAQRNRGTGTEIVKRLIDEAHRKSKGLELEVMKNNRAGALYRLLGFVSTGELKYKLQMTWGGFPGG